MKYKLLLLALLMSSTLHASTTTTLSIKSKKMKHDIPATLILPDSYKNKNQDFPVLYLLHGAGDNHGKWNIKTNIAELADQYNIIIVCPNGGGTSWYLDSPIDPKYQYERFVAKECVKYIDKNYRTKAHRDFRALAGNSMGGHGSIFLAVRHKDTFSAALLLSAGVDIRPFPNNWGIKSRIGSIETHKENWETYTACNVAKDLKDGELAISIDCGDKDFFLNVNRDFHQQLLKAGVKHEYIENPGAHNWNYWKEAIKRQMPFIAKHFANGKKSKK